MPSGKPGKSKFRRTALRADRKALFLRVLAETGNITLAASRAGGARNLYYGWRRQDPGFAKAWDEAMRDFEDRAKFADGAAASEAVPALDGEGGERSFAASAEAQGLTLWHSASGATKVVRVRSDTKLSTRRRAEFLRQLSSLGSVELAAEAVGVSTTALYKLRGKDAGFARKWDEAAHGPGVADRLRSAVMDGVLTEMQRREDADGNPVALSGQALDRGLRTLAYLDKRGDGFAAGPHGEAPPGYMKVPTAEEADALLEAVIAKFDAAARQRRHEVRVKRAAKRRQAAA